MGTKTAQELKNEAWALLTGSGPYEAPSAEGAAVMETYMGPLIAQLNADEVVYVPNTDEIPDEYFLALARLLANVAGPRFGTPINEEAKRADEDLLKRLNRSPATRLYLKANDSQPRRGYYRPF